jgi:hypothetical protein
MKRMRIKASQPRRGDSCITVSAAKAKITYRKPHHHTTQPRRGDIIMLPSLRDFSVSTAGQSDGYAPLHRRLCTLHACGVPVSGDFQARYRYSSTAQPRRGDSCITVSVAIAELTDRTELHHLAQPRRGDIIMLPSLRDLDVRAIGRTAGYAPLHHRLCTLHACGVPVSGDFQVRYGYSSTAQPRRGNSCITVSAATAKLTDKTAQHHTAQPRRGDIINFLNYSI